MENIRGYTNHLNAFSRGFTRAKACDYKDRYPDEARIAHFEGRGKEKYETSGLNEG
jgi:hypothetical protein